MKTLSLTLSLGLLVSPAVASVTISFDEFASPAPNYASNAGFVSQGTSFNGAPYAGFVVSNSADTTTPGFTNQYSAITGSGFGGTGSYAIAYDSSAYGPTSTVNLPAHERPESVRVTNTTYAYLAIRDGNDGYGGVRMFGDDPGTPAVANEGVADLFSVTFTGFAAPDAGGGETGSVTFHLADYRFAENADDVVVAGWALVDLTPLGEARSFTVTMSTTDMASWGDMATPAYVALDDLKLIPEPAGLSVLLGGVALLIGRRRRTT